MNWVKHKLLPVTKAIKHNGCPCTSNDMLWQALNNSYNSATDQQINQSILNKITTHELIEWPLFSKAEFRDTIAKCNNSSALGLDHVT